MNTLKRSMVRATILSACALMLIGCDFFKSDGNDDKTPPKEVEEPAKIISIRQAKDMYDIYTKRKVPALQQGAVNQELNMNDDGTVTVDPDFAPTRYIEYSLKEMKQYIAYIEKEAKLANVDIDNLRIYLGAYPIQGGSFPNGDAANYNRQETIFIMPTTRHEGKQKGFYTTGNANGRNRRAVYLEDVIADMNGIDGKRNKDGKKLGKKVSQASMVSFSNMLEDDRSLILNNGNVIPPPKQNTDMGGSN